MDQALPGEGQLIHHAQRRDRIGEEKTKVGNLLRLITEYNNLQETSEREGTNARLDLDIDGKNTEIRIQRDSMWDIDVLTKLHLVPSD
jgi:hypothetical protein